jgi:hypothetical protein
MDQSSAYKKIEARLKSNAYKNDQTQYVKNLKYLKAEERRLTKKNQNTIKNKKAHGQRIAKLELLLEEMDPRLKQKLLPAWINKTLEQGDCFYSSIFRALKERKLLDSTASILDLDKSTELRFVRSFRKKVADEILAGRLPADSNQYGQPEDTYDFFSGMGSALTEIIDNDDNEMFADWFKNEFRLGVGTRDHFQKTAAKYASKMKEFASEFEMQIARRLLKSANVILDVEGKRKPAVIKIRDGSPVITVFNEHGGHYEYYSFNPRCTQKTYVRNPSSRACHPPCKENEERTAPNYSCTCVPGTKRDKKTRKCVPDKKK